MKYSFIWPIASLVAVAAIVMLVSPRLIPSSGTPSSQTPATNGSTPLAMGLTITNQGSHAFGSLAQASVQPTGMGGGGGLGMTAESRSAAQYAPATPMPPMEAGVPASEPAADAKMNSMIARPYFYQRDHYVYDGPDLTLDPQVTVYRHLPHKIDASALTSFVQSLQIGPINLGSFGNVDVQQFSFVQPGDKGYQVYVDLTNGMININQNYSTWPHPEAACRDEACYNNLRLTQKDVPEDAALIAIADEFLSSHGIGKDNYDAPQVQHQFGPTIMPLAADATTNAPSKAEFAEQIYVPDSMTVVYPLKLGGLVVYDQSGNPYGISVGIDLRSKKVTGVWNLNTLDYQSSDYEGITDQKTILDIASRGDMYAQAFGIDPNEKSKDVPLGEPQKVLMQAYHTRDDGQGEELLVPALRFPIKGTDRNDTYRQAVMVPLVKDLLTPPVIMYMKGGMGGGTASSGGVATPPSEPVPEPKPLVK